MGSDHHPIRIDVPLRESPKRPVTFIKWDAFRANMDSLRDLPLDRRIVEAVNYSKTTYQVKEDTPTPDLHLTNLWASRLSALTTYRTKRTLRRKVKLNLATARAKRYTLELFRNRWRGLCNSFNERTGLRRVWRTYEGLAGKTKARNTGSNLALRLEVSEDDLVNKAEDLLKKLVRSLLVSKVVYGLNYLRLTKTQEAALVVLNRKAMRVITGLPKFTPVEQLEAAAQINTLRDIAKEMDVGQENRLARSPPGRIILTKLEKHELLAKTAAMPTPSPPWDNELVVPIKPVPKNQGKEHRGRRKHAADKQLEEINSLTGAEVMNTTWSGITHKTNSPKTAELLALLHAIQEAAHTLPRTVTEARIFTDSREALQECGRGNSRNPVVKQIKSIIVESRPRVNFVLSWVPGHEGVPGHERANEAARAQLHAGFMPSPGHGPPLVEEDPGLPPDIEEIKKEERAARNLRLGALLPPDEDPVPPGYSRPATYEDWTRPRLEHPHRKHILDSLISFVRSSGIAYVFEKARPSRVCGFPQHFMDDLSFWFRVQIVNPCIKVELPEGFVPYESIYRLVVTSTVDPVLAGHFGISCVQRKCGACVFKIAGCEPQGTCCHDGCKPLEPPPPTLPIIPFPRHNWMTLSRDQARGRHAHLLKWLNLFLFVFSPERDPRKEVHKAFPTEIRDRDMKERFLSYLCFLPVLSLRYIVIMQNQLAQQLILIQCRGNLATASIDL
ncbi:hypothetical protein HPB47_022402 [Ixodes persulcatus]|uniref:Uncharacterized protein n=1 Tax=Ixodes persulcatus TaxID=34615 RepID=A0AC60Q9T7_IXOPE|nr:hypothetical protein HPB47_022402 [Ixodes persulcatus]